MQKAIEITLVRSPIATTPNQREVLRGLGLRHRHSAIVRKDSPSLRGMIRKVIHLVDIRWDEGKAKAPAKKAMFEVIPSKEAPAKKIEAKPATEKKAAPKKATPKPTAKTTVKKKGK